jgi:hypothetical protein
MLIRKINSIVIFSPSQPLGWTKGQTSNYNQINSEANSNSNIYSPPNKDKKNIKTIKQFDDILSKKQINIHELRYLSWNGIPFGNLFLL